MEGMQKTLEEAFARLNDEQREAVETLDGPVLVVAGPGTGKTQLLSLRVAHILQSRDVSPHNIICLTFTNAGAEAMRERLMSFIGRSAYEVSIETFHSFALDLRSRFPEYFKRGVFDEPITDLASAQLVNALLKELPVTDPLYQSPFDGVSGNLRPVRGLIGKIKRSGLSPVDLIAICGQNTAFFDYFEQENPGLLDRLALSLQKGSKEEKARKLDDLKADLLAALDPRALPAGLTERLVTLTGSYEPYAVLLRRVVTETDFYDEKVNTSGFRTEVRDRFFSGRPLMLKERGINAATCSAVSLYQRYQDHLKANALFDYDDMVLDAVAALGEHPEFAAALRDQYQYILIDEFQDTNGAQMRIIESIVAGVERPNILAVGDDDQAIMRFQGASVEFINQFEHKYTGTHSIILKKNYRSVPSIVDLGQQVAGQIEDRLASSRDAKHLEAARPAGGDLDFSPRVFPSAEVQYNEIARELRALIGDGFMERSEHPGSEIAVIARKHSSLRALIPYLEHHGVAFNYRVKREVSQIASLQTLFSLMRFVVYWANGRPRWAEAELPQIIAAPELGIGEECYLSLACRVRAAGGWLEALKSSGESSLKRLYSRLAAAAVMAVTAPVREAILTLAEDIVAYYEARREQDPYTLIELNYGLKALLDFAQEEIESHAPRRCMADESLLGIQRGDSKQGGLRDEDRPGTLKEEGRTSPEQREGKAGPLHEGDRPGSLREGRAPGPLRLAAVVELLEQSERFGIEVAASVPIASKDAVTLTSAHNSKGLEYDRVYLIDANRENWRKSVSGSSLIAQNIYLSESEDIDDFRRLLFVAATRARDELRISLTGSSLVPELVGVTEPHAVTVDVEDVGDVAPLSWQDAYLPQEENLADLAARLLEHRKLSVSLLNSFVEYKGNSLDGTSFLAEKLLSLPQKPSLSLDFGNVVHDYLSGYLDEVVKGGTKTEGDLIGEAKDALAVLDHPEADLAHLFQRFDLFLARFMPEFKSRLDEHAFAEQSFDVILDEVPLTGRIDLLVCDENTQTIAIYDYKTGTAKNANRRDSGYRRQLQFYKLLVENAPQFKGWRVSGGADIFVEPDRKDNLNLASEEFITVGDGELEHLRLLIQAVWHRLQNNLLDTSGFLQSKQLATLKAATVYKSTSGGHKKGDPKEPSAAEYQAAYEQWLIDEYCQGQT